MAPQLKGHILGSQSQTCPHQRLNSIYENFQLISGGSDAVDDDIPLVDGCGFEDQSFFKYFS